MFERWYKIKGITKELFENWKNELRTDIITWEDGDGIEARIRLNWIEAKILEYRIKLNNNRQSYYRLRLIRM